MGRARLRPPVLASDRFSKTEAEPPEGGVHGTGVWLRPTQFNFRKGFGRRRKRALQNEGNPDSRNSTLGCPVLAWVWLGRGF
jgi:hypothetical protein